jgi:flagellar biosynthesis protein FlhF
MATTTEAQIHVKSYFATSVPAAIELARRELGPDALLLNSREAPPEARHLGPIEVVFGHDAGSRGMQLHAMQKESFTAPAMAATPSYAAMTQDMEQLRQSVDKIWNLLLKSTRGEAWPSPGQTRQRLVEQALMEMGVTREIAAEMDDAVAANIGEQTAGFSSDVVLRATIEEIERRFPVRPGLGRITALVGPPGSGKTTTLVKLAVAEGLMKNKPVRILSADTQRIAASEQLRIYAAILGVPFQSVETIPALAHAIDSAPANTLLLIDTPGLSPAALDGPAADLAGFVRRRQDIDTHVVLTAPTRQKDLERANDRFAIFNPSALIFTKLDETEAPGGLFSEAARTDTPISFFANGQGVPENLAPASTACLTEALVRQLPLLLLSAA